MTAIAIQPPLPSFKNAAGQPLSNGSIYIGQANQDPRSYPIGVFYDEAGTIPAQQPLRTTGGYIYRNGAPSNAWVTEAEYSILVLDASGRQVSYTPAATASSVASFGFLQAGPGAVSRPAQDKLRDVVSVRDFGAVGDGVTDDTDAITKWLAVIAKASSQGAGAYGFVPPGVYLFSGEITVTSCVIQGAGQHASVFKAGSADARVLFEGPAGGDDSQGINGSYCDFTIDGGDLTTSSLVKLGIVNYPRFDSVAIINSADDGLELEGTQNGLFTNCTIKTHGGTNVVFSDGTHPTFGAIGAAGNLFLKSEIATYGAYAIDSTGKSFNNTFEECGIEYSSDDSLAAVRLNNTDSQVNAMCIRGGFVVVRHAIPVFHLIDGTLNFDGGQAYGANVGTSLFYLDGAGTLLKTAGNCHFSGATYLFFAHNAGAFVYDLGNYFNFCANDYGTDAGGLQDSVVGRPMYSQLQLRRGQIKFPAVQIPSSNANTLDDDEEGSFTPAVLCNGSGTGVTMTTAQGRYTKIGKLVFVKVNVAAGISGAGAGAVTISGLPFTPGTSTPGTLAVGSFFGFAAGTVISAQVHSNPSTYIDLYTPNNGSAQVGNRAMQTSDLGANIGITLSGCYESQD